METKVCKCCGRELPIGSFKNTRWGHYTEVCIECETKHRRAKKQERIENEVKKQANKIDENRKLCLADFTPRELMEELARRGYKGKLQYVQVTEIDITNF